MLTVTVLRNAKDRTRRYFQLDVETLVKVMVLEASEVSSTPF
jgi:hypothetical protein